MENLKSLDNADALKLLVKLFKALPEVEEGEIIPEKNSSTVIKEAVTKSGIKYEVSSENISGNGGFIFKSAGLVIDNTWDQLVERQKENIESEIANTLFYA